MTPYWTCVKAACLVVPLSPVALAGYLALHPPPPCQVDCHWVIPPSEWGPGGYFGRQRGASPGRLSSDWGSNTAAWPVGGGGGGSDLAAAPRSAFYPRPVPVKEIVPVLTSAPTPTPVPVPEPASALMLAAGVVMLWGLRRGRGAAA